jgi:hypothetical protein
MFTISTILSSFGLSLQYFQSTDKPKPKQRKTLLTWALGFQPHLKTSTTRVPEHSDYAFVVQH